MGPFHQDLTPSSTVTPSALLKTLRTRGVTQHTAPMAEPDCLPTEGSSGWAGATLGLGYCGPTFPVIMGEKGRLDREAQTPTNGTEPQWEGTKQGSGEARPAPPCRSLVWASGDVPL